MKDELWINGIDAFTRWGIVLGDTSLSALMTPVPNKEFVSNKSRLTHGKSVIVNSPVMNERSISITFYLLAVDKTDFYSKYDDFCASVLSTGRIDIRTKYQQGVTYRTIYDSCSQFSQFEQGIAKFVLKLTEPDPSNRSA